MRRLFRKGWQCKFPGQTKGAADASVATIVKQTARSTRRRINKHREIEIEREEVRGEHRERGTGLIIMIIWRDKLKKLFPALSQYLQR